MKFGSKFRHGATALGITALVIVVVILLNVGFSALCSGSLWFSDLTSERMFTLNKETKNMLKDTFQEVNAKREADGEEPVKVEIIFCSDPDILKGNESMRYIYYTALELQKAFPKTIDVKTTNVWKNPSSVDAYRTNSYSSIYETNIIIASGTEYRVQNIRSFYTYNSSTESEPWAYNGEKIFTRAMIAVTKAESPICGITVGHGEPFETEDGRTQYQQLLNVIESAGYEIQFLNLAEQEIPERCRLLLTFDPQTDFLSNFTGASVSEISKLNNFLANAYSYMIFVDADTPVLFNLEELLERWGISFDRYADPTDSTNILGNYQVISDASIDSEGQALIATYAQEALGGSITENMRKNGGSPKVVFGNAMPISYSASYEKTFVLADEENGTGAFHYGSYYKNNHSRSIFDVFLSDKDAVAAVRANGTLMMNGADPFLADTQGNYRLMTVTREDRTIGEGKGYTNVNDSSYVCAIGSTDFASNTLLGSNAYGNTDVLLETLRAIGREVVPVGLDFKPLYSSEMTQTYTDSNGKTAYYYTDASKTAWTIVLVLIPFCTVATVGTVKLVRRKFAA